jgi:exodeoxyribonuclease VII small subunit
METQDSGFEGKMRRLQAIVQELEKTDLPLERNVALYKEGRTLVKECGEMLEKARHEISLASAEGEADSPYLAEDAADDDKVFF